MENVEPIRLSISVPLSQDRAFTLFADRIDTWWPLEAFAVSRENVAGCAFVDGRVVERAKSGEEHVWAEVLAFERPHRLVLAWHPGGGPSTEVEVTFTPSDDGTLVELEHRRWDAFAERAAEARGEYAGGWQLVFVEGYGAAAQAVAAG